MKDDLIRLRYGRHGEPFVQQKLDLHSSQLHSIFFFQQLTMSIISLDVGHVSRAEICSVRYVNSGEWNLLQDRIGHTALFVPEQAEI